MKILIIQQKRIGDVLFSTIILKALRENYPTAELHYVAETNTLPILENNPYIDNIIPLTETVKSDKGKFYTFLKSIKKQQFSIVIDAYGKNSSALMSLFSGAETRIGFKKFYSRFAYTDTVKRLDQPEHNCSLAIENRMRLLYPLGILFKPLKPKIFLTQNEIDRGKTILLQSPLNPNNPIVMVSVIGSKLNKTYPAPYMVELLEFCCKTFPKTQYLFNYIPAQKEQARAIYEACSKDTQKHIFFDVFAKGLRDFFALMHHCQVVIGNEGGANNMAKSLNIPTFTIFSPRLEKKNWFGADEIPYHEAVHISDYAVGKGIAHETLKKNGADFYQKMTPDLIKPKLKTFLDKILS